MSELQIRFDRAPREYADLRKRCEAQVASWRWATWKMLGDGPYFFERKRLSPGRWLKKEPAARSGRYQYGFDASDRVIVVREILTWEKGRETWKETFYRYGDGVIDSAHFDQGQPKAPINVKRTILQDGRVVAVESWAKYGRSTEIVTWKNGLPVEMTDCSQEHGKAEKTSRFLFTHDDLGRLVRIQQESHGNASEIYRRPEKGEDTASLARLIGDRLFELIPTTVAAARVTKPAYVLLLAYDLENPDSCLPPLLAIGLEEERTRWLKEHGREAEDYLWNPAEFSVYDTPKLHLRDRALDKACALLTQQLALKGRFGPIFSLLEDVGRRLNRRDWSKELVPTTDFIVVPVDLEGTHLRRHLRAMKAT